MNKKELILRLAEIDERLSFDREVAHLEADATLLAFIDDPEISQAYDAIDKWYA